MASAFLEIGTKCSFIIYKLRFFTNFCLTAAASKIFFNILRDKNKIGAGNEIRTRDPDLGKVVLYQLSYSRTVLLNRAFILLGNVVLFPARVPLFQALWLREPASEAGLQRGRYSNQMGCEVK